MRTLRHPLDLSSSSRSPSGHRAPPLLSLPTAALLLAALLCNNLATAADLPRKWQWTTSEQVVVIGDVHGAYHSLVDLLEQSDLISSDGRWSGGTSHLVMLGDFLDRGPRSREVLDLVMRLQDEAKETGGAMPRLQRTRHRPSAKSTSTSVFVRRPRITVI